MSLEYILAHHNLTLLNFFSDLIDLNKWRNVKKVKKSEIFRLKRRENQRKLI
jgi:hypothetical protein